MRDLKSFARVGEEERSAVDVVAALRKALKLASAEIRCRARLTDDIRSVPAVAGNEGRLAQVFVNLLINAAQAIDEGAPERNEIHVATRTTERAVEIEIADTGRGIPPEHVERLFDPFFTTKSASEGSGLGLAICFNIVSAYRGRIEVESTPGRGARFVVALPIAKVPALAIPVEAPPPAPARRARVLVIDDEPFVLSTIKIILGRDHEVVSLDDAAEALRLVGEDHGFDVVLCDLMLQRSSGMEVYAELVRTAPELARRMVFMTGGAYTPQARAFVARVPNPCIDKPFGAAELTKAVQQVFAVDQLSAA